MNVCIQCDSTNITVDENITMSEVRWETCLDCGLGIAVTKKEGPITYWLKGHVHGSRIPEGCLLVLKEWPL